MILTEQHILKGKGINNGWTQEQLVLLGVPDCLLTDGWKARLVGKHVAEDAYEEFLRLTSCVRIRNAGWTDRSTASIAATKSTKRWLNVPYKDKEKAKVIGARWNPERKQWWVSESVPVVDVKQWL